MNSQDDFLAVHERSDDGRVFDGDAAWRVYHQGPSFWNQVADAESSRMEETVDAVWVMIGTDGPWWVRPDLEESESAWAALWADAEAEEEENR